MDDHQLVSFWRQLGSIPLTAQQFGMTVEQVEAILKKYVCITCHSK